MEDYQKFGRKTKLLIHPDNIPDTEISLPNNKQVKTTSEEGENSENYPVSCGRSKATLNTTSSIEMLNYVDCPVEETINEINISLISAPYQVTEGTARTEHTDEERTDEMLWNRLKSLLSNKSVVKRSENSSFSFFL